MQNQKKNLNQQKKLNQKISSIAATCPPGEKLNQKKRKKLNQNNRFIKKEENKPIKKKRIIKKIVYREASSSESDSDDADEVEVVKVKKDKNKKVNLGGSYKRSIKDKYKKRQTRGQKKGNSKI